VGPRFLIRDRDNKFGPDSERAAVARGARIIKTAIRTPDMNATCERFIGSVRRECLDHVISVSEQHLLAVLTEYACYGRANEAPLGCRGALGPGIRPR
jgi:putative transposase